MQKRTTNIRYIIHKLNGFRNMTIALLLFFFIAFQVSQDGSAIQMFKECPPYDGNVTGTNKVHVDGM